MRAPVFYYEVPTVLLNQQYFFPGYSKSLTEAVLKIYQICQRVEVHIYSYSCPAQIMAVAKACLKLYNAPIGVTASNA